MSKQKSSAKCLLITDAEELNPFSFREFLRWKDLGQDQDPEQTDRKASQRLFDLEPSSLTFDPEVRSCFFAGPSLSGLTQQAEEEEDEGWGRSCHSAAVDSTSSICTEEEEEEEETKFSSKPERRNSKCSQLKEEIVFLRRTIRELQEKSDANECRVVHLSEELVQRRHQEEKEAQDLESMVHSVEQNLHLMTKRALKAESSVLKLKLELQQLQSQVEAYRLENEHLKSEESEVVMTMRHNAQLASEYLKKSAGHAQSSIQVLLGEAETLCLVSQLLQSIDKISHLKTES
ncbi:endosome-associated-trafficking regulator 1 [Diretmus argenteus]